MAYDNGRRAAAARRTRACILRAAADLFLANGYGATTIREVARAAGVSQETIYKSTGGKAPLLKAVWDVTLAGDDEDLPLAARPEAQAVRAATNPDQAATAYAELAAVVSARTDPLLRLLLGARGSDPALGEFADEVDAERLAGSSAVVRHWFAAGWIRPDLTAEKAGQILWALNSPGPRWHLLDIGWSSAEFTTWLADTIRRSILA
ncbi:TetR family transcriptional regulator [Rhodococcoides trifolii]|uniref:TetR family transcriptional regulator n=1 Tax=Rhodococcoides trifolii TaxID=908250 RepID=A0A917FRB2_9NOCA|nr:TetR family transcriptional regulator [Rhodococcus trifolii]